MLFQRRYVSPFTVKKNSTCLKVSRVLSGSELKVAENTPENVKLNLLYKTTTSDFFFIFFDLGTQKPKVRFSKRMNAYRIQNFKDIQKMKYSI